LFLENYFNKKTYGIN